MGSIERGAKRGERERESGKVAEEEVEKGFFLRVCRKDPTNESGRWRPNPAPSEANQPPSSPIFVQPSARKPASTSNGWPSSFQSLGCVLALSCSGPRTAILVRPSSGLQAASCSCRRWLRDGPAHTGRQAQARPRIGTCMPLYTTSTGTKIRAHTNITPPPPARYDEGPLDGTAPTHYESLNAVPLPTALADAAILPSAPRLQRDSQQAGDGGQQRDH